jgi:hypothetical protein
VRQSVEWPTGTNPIYVYRRLKAIGPVQSNDGALCPRLYDNGSSAHLCFYVKWPNPISIYVRKEKRYDHDCTLLRHSRVCRARCSDVRKCKLQREDLRGQFGDPPLQDLILIDQDRPVLDDSVKKKAFEASTVRQLPHHPWFACLLRARLLCEFHSLRLWVVYLASCRVISRLVEEQARYVWFADAFELQNTRMHESHHGFFRLSSKETGGRRQRQLDDHRDNRALLPIRVRPSHVYACAGTRLQTEDPLAARMPIIWMT